MLRTALLCAALALGGYASASWLTHDFQVWTAEGARRLEVALTPVAAPAVRVEGPDAAPQPLPQLLGDGRSVVIVDFFYTRCRAVCLALGSVFQQMQAALQAADESGAPAGVRLLSISFDPERDTTQDLQRYAARMKAQPRWWRFVRPADTQQAARLLASYQVVVVPDGRGDFEHNAALLVVDQRGRLVRVFDPAEQQLALDYARDLAAREVQ